MKTFIYKMLKLTEIHPINTVKKTYTYTRDVYSAKYLVLAGLTPRPDIRSNIHFITINIVSDRIVN